MLKVSLMLAGATFVVGTATYFVAGVLGGIAGDLGVSVSAAGQLMSAFAVAYALMAPVLVAVTAHVERRRLITLALLAFAAANLLAALAPDFGMLIVSRVLAALAAALITPVAVATAAQLAPEHRRGAVMALVMGGITLAFAFGVPLGTWIGDVFGWRLVFGAAALAAVAAALGVLRVVPVVEGSERVGPFASFRVLRQPQVAALLALTALTFTAVFTVFAFIGPVLAELTGLGAGPVSGLLLLFGLSAIAGTAGGGLLADRVDVNRAVTVVLLLLGVSHAGFSALAMIDNTTVRIVGITVIMVLAALPGFAFVPLQQLRLVSQAGTGAPMALALHASALFLGQGLGAVVGGVAAAGHTLVHNGYVACSIGLLTALASVAVNRVLLRPNPVPAYRAGPP